MTKHTCHAELCTRQVPPRMLMCTWHWRMVPPVERHRVWAAYRPGQEVDKRPTPEYLEAARAAIAAVAEHEVRRIPGRGA